MLEPRAAAGLPPNPHGDGLATVGIIMCVIAGVLVVCRMLTRIFVAKAVGWDDYTLVFSMMLAIGMTVCFNMEVYYGMGLHTVEVKNAEHKVKAMTWLWAAQLPCKFANASTKISIALLYLRIFPSKRFRLMVWAFIAFVIAYCSAAIFASIFQCKPIAKAWHKTLDGTCIDIGIVWYVNSAMTLTADAILILLPITNIIKLQLPKAQKAALLFVFGLGVFVMACTIVRCVALGPTTSKKDSMFYQSDSNSWTFLEVDVSIICAALSILRAPISRIFPRLFSNMSTRKNTGMDSGRPTAGYGQRSGGPSAISMQDRSEWQKTAQTSHYVRGLRDAMDDDEDAASDEERILGRQQGIHKTTEVTFGYEAMSKGSIR